MAVRLRPLVLLVDDDPAVCGALAFALELEGYDVSAFASGEALLDHDLEERPACLVLDQRLPGASGLDTLAALRARGFDHPALLITSHPERAVRDAAARAGAAIIEKPLMGDALAAGIRLALGT